MRYKVVVAYNGNHYYGWQSQPSKATIQATIENALKKITKKATPITSSGRTDAKVHALGQVFHFDTDLTMASNNHWVLAFNSNLPNDIHVISVESVSDQFHARFDVIKKRYEYHIETGPYHVLEYPFVYQFNKPLSVNQMIACSKCFIGTHDFTSFNATPLAIHANQVRTIETIDVISIDSKIIVGFEGKGFLHHMVLMLVAVMIEVGADRLSIERVKQLLESKDKNASRYKAMPHGLLLKKVWYPDED